MTMNKNIENSVDTILEESNIFANAELNREKLLQLNNDLNAAADELDNSISEINSRLALQIRRINNKLSLTHSNNNWLSISYKSSQIKIKPNVENKSFELDKSNRFSRNFFKYYSHVLDDVDNLESLAIDIVDFFKKGYKSLR